MDHPDFIAFSFMENSHMVHCLYWGVTEYYLQKDIVFLSPKIDFVLANSVDADEMLRSAGIHCMQMCSQSTKGSMTSSVKSTFTTWNSPKP